MGIDDKGDQLQNRHGLTQQSRFEAKEARFEAKEVGEVLMV